MKSALFDRENELALLRERAKLAFAGTPQLVLLYGLRRVGKTFLLTHLLHGLPSEVTRIYFAASEQGERIELQRFTDAVRGASPDDRHLPPGPFATWEQALATLAGMARRRPVAVVLDEMPFLAESTPGFASLVKNMWDELVLAGEPVKLLLALTGSAVSTMRKLRGSEGALYRRPTLDLRLGPFDLATATRFLDAPPETAIEAYAACGGYPLHLRAWDPELPAAENLVRLAGEPGSILLEDAQAMLRELTGGAGYHRILAAVGQGRTRYSDIAHAAELRIEHSLDTLTDSGYLRRMVPIGAPRRARGLYEIPDPYLRFWFSVLFPNRQLIETGQGRQVLVASEPRWASHVGWTFEEAARGHAVRLVQAGHLPGDVVVGRWWTTTGQPAEIDVLGLQGKRVLLAGEAKWSTHPFRARNLSSLRARAEAADATGLLPDDVTFALWNRGGVSPDLAGSGVLAFGPSDVTTAAGAGD